MVVEALLCLVGELCLWQVHLLLLQKIHVSVCGHDDVAVYLEVQTGYLSSVCMVVFEQSRRTQTQILGMKCLSWISGRNMGRA